MQSGRVTAMWDCDHVLFLSGEEPPTDMTKDKVMAWKKDKEALVTNLAIMIGIAQDYNKTKK
jgi:hypothetical protein